ncbi:hypothetical protein BG842_06255 [Haladaptatus sp. W1]|uniref:hypothetical protein n=1 Tax=Haladaptatus sp. W1 TaxID=1897478 RepID=UPI000849DD63|nr:hypothetical protein [Haladaptatus sp. W1]ODR80252.1 hypothetical protein BG842_06255 [Haladaptatus sp. W1]
MQDGGEERHTEYEGWTLLGSDDTKNHSEEIGDSQTVSEGKNDWGPPPTMRKSLLRDQIRERLGVSHRQWYTIEAVLIALPYLLFVTVYLLFPVNETAFIVVTLAYSLVAMYVGFVP